MNKRNEILVGLLICLSILLSISFISAWSDDLTLVQNVDDCGNLITENAVYTLNSSVSTLYTCFNIQANNITLDGAGYTITFGGDSTVVNYKGVYSTFNSTIIKNCKITGTAGQTKTGMGIFFLNSNNGIINNNTIILSGDSSFIETGIGIRTSSNNMISNNIIYNDGSTPSNIGILLDIYSNFNIIKENIITISGYDGLSHYGGSNNIYLNNIVTDSGVYGYGIFIYETVTNNSFLNLNVQTIEASALYLWDGNIDFIMKDSILNSSLSSDVFIKSTVDGGNWSFINVTQSDGSPINITDESGRITWNLIDVCNFNGICESGTGTNYIFCSNFSCESGTGETYATCPSDCSPTPTPPMSWEEVDLDENIVDPNNSEQGLLPSIYYGLATFLSNIMTPAIIIIFVIFFVMIIGTIGVIIKKIAMKI